MKMGNIAAVGVLLSFGALVAAAVPAGATPQDDVTAMSTCYGDAPTFHKVAGNTDFPIDNYLKTSSRCSDINIKPRTSMYVKVCFAATGSCQANFKYAAAGQWTVVATNVRDNSQFWFRFSSTSANSGFAAY
jgi:hypothetical protein